LKIKKKAEYLAGFRNPARYLPLNKNGFNTFFTSHPLIMKSSEVVCGQFINPGGVNRRLPF